MAVEKEARGEGIEAIVKRQELKYQESTPRM